MMHTLILMRHAKSDWSAGQSDNLRPLNPRGRAAAKAMGDWLRDKDLVPDQVISSDATRTGQTVEGLALEAPVIFTPALYHASADTMLKVVHTAQGKTLLIVGHNPGIADFAHRLCDTPPSHPRFMDYPTCATTVIRWDVEGWNDIGWRGDKTRGQPIEFAIPREVMG